MYPFPRATRDENHHVWFNDPTVEHQLGEDDNNLTKATIIVRKDTVPAGTFEGLTKQCHDFVITVLGKDNFCGEHRIKPSPQRTVSWAGEEVQEVSGHGLPA